MIVSSSTDDSGQKATSAKSKKPKVVSTIDTLLQPSEDTFINLRPTRLQQYIGQEKLVKNLKLILDSALKRVTLPDHMLFYGQPGLGKTTLASLIATELNANFKIIAAPSLQKVGDLVSLLVNLEPQTVLFIDEIHRLKAPLEETLYSAMEDHKVDLMMGKGQGASTARLDLNPFVLVGATTQIGKVSKPLRDRFPSHFHLQPYTEEEIRQLVEANCQIMGLFLSPEVVALVCERSRGIPRISNNILKRLYDLQVVHNLERVEYKDALHFFQELGIYRFGLTRVDLQYLRALLSGTLALKTLSGILLEDAETLELVTESYLIHLAFLEKDSSGRRLTPKGREFILTFDGEKHLI
jgi:Holliday junction DNA helicase RuvB